MHVEEPRIIFVGGSNLSFGLNSTRIKQSLNLNPINTAISAALGLKYMLDNTQQYVRKNDVIIIVPEYLLFYQPYDVTSDYLLRVVFDVAPEKRKLLSIKQELNLLEYLPKFSLSKFRPSQYRGFKENAIYGVNSFNEFGDCDAHWNLEKTKFPPDSIGGMFNEAVVKKIKEFESIARSKGAAVYLTYPCLDRVSFNISKDKILYVEKKLKEYEFDLLGDAQRYVMPTEMMYNTPYHLNKNGVDLRTDLFIEDYKKAGMLITTAP